MKLNGEKEVLKQDWQVLVGFWDESTAMGFVQGQGIPLKPDEISALQNKFRIARQYVQGLPERRDNPEIRPMEADASETLRNKLESEGTFKEHLTGMGSRAEIVWVELAKLIVSQPLLNSSYIESMRVPPETELDQVIEFCLPLTSKGPLRQAIQALNAATNTFSIITENLDFRILGPVQGEDPQSHRKFVGFGALPFWRATYAWTNPRRHARLSSGGSSPRPFSNGYRTYRPL